VIHKLEYFLNARIVGIQINARAWELLIAMLLIGGRLRPARPDRRTGLLRLSEE
jgi:hypothetical protein